MSETDALLALNAVEGLSNRQIHKLLNYFGSAQKIFNLRKSDVIGLNIVTQKAFGNILHFPTDKFLKNEYNLINNNIKVIKYTDNNYPTLLKEIDDAPVVLYVEGDGLDESEITVAIVGSRKASMYGMMVAEKFASRLAEHNICIVSGLARGIDSAAHRGVLKSKGRTIAVLGCGLACQYPKENEKLRDQICAQGAVISEFPMLTKPLPYNFPRRNRIVSGLSKGVTVVEAAAKSGALITADFALDQGRDVYAVPSHIDHPNSLGTHELIKQGAKLVTSVEEIIEEYCPDRAPRKEAPAIRDISDRNNDQLDPELSDSEKNLVRHLGRQPVHIDELVALTHTDITATSVMLMQLEMKNLVKQLPGKRFKR